MMKTVATALVLGTALLASASASAQNWGGYDRGYGYGYRDQRDDDARLIQATCSGQRGFEVEARLRHEVRDGDIDWRTASRIQDKIDRLQDKERHECGEGDYRAARDIGRDYSRIGAWIDQEAANRYAYRPRYRGW